MANRVRVSLAQQAVDQAFVNDVGDLFKRYKESIRQEPATRNARNSHASAEFQKEYALSVTTHTEMSQHIAETTPK